MSPLVFQVQPSIQVEYFSLHLLIASETAVGSHGPNLLHHEPSSFSGNRLVALAFRNRSVAQFIQLMRRDIFQAIADPTRRAIIALIALQPMTPNGIAENFHTTRQAVSKHLRTLTECELVTPEYRGREIYYSLQIEKMKEIDKWLEQYRKIWETRYRQLEDLLTTVKRQEKEK